MLYFAELNNENIAINLLETHEEPTGHFVHLDFYDSSVLGKKYENGEWVDVSQPDSAEPEPTQLDRIEEAVNKTQEQIANDAVDAYTEELLERGIL